jgi:hypothetical protein
MILLPILMDTNIFYILKVVQNLGQNQTPNHHYQNLSTTDQNAIDWYNEQIASASLYDELNQDNLFYDVPEYLRNDSSKPTIYRFC